jgi:hypothetical protein
MVPFIWAGNAVLVLGIKYLALGRRINKAGALLFGAVLKTAFLFGSAYALFTFGFVPGAVLGAMGVLQLQTALLGGGAALIIHEGKKRIFG